VRASVVEVLNKVPTDQWSIAELQQELDIPAGEVKAFNSLVYRMADNGLIKGISTEHGKFYGAKDGSDYVPGTDALDSVDKFVAGASAKTTKRAYKAAPAKVLDMLAGLTIDISKSTGRIRLTTNGMTIDIGVIA
jgi:hypothetical protein